MAELSLPPTLPSPPDGGPNGGPPASTFDELFDSLQSFAAAHGYAVTKRNAANYRDGKPTRYIVACDRGKRRVSSSRGIRQVSTKKNDCEWRGTATAKQSNNWGWIFETKVGTHNHGPSENPGAHSVHRRLSKEQKILVACLSKFGVRTRDIIGCLREHYEDCVAGPKDVDNYIQKLRREKAAEEAVAAARAAAPGDGAPVAAPAPGAAAVSAGNGPFPQPGQPPGV